MPDVLLEASGDVNLSGSCHLSFGGSPCAKPSATRYVAACIHEHVTEFEACEDCEAGHLFRTPWLCNECRDGTEPHECRAAITRMEGVTHGTP